MVDIDEHLGGGEGRCWTDEGCLDWAINNLNIKSMIDIGCGQACQVELAREKNLRAIGVEGDPRCIKEDLQIQFDFSKGKFSIEEKFDLAWSVEFLEHVYEEFIPNYMTAFQAAKYVICTHAPPGKKGYHHVNCNTKEYWIDIFDQYGFDFNEKLTNKVRTSTTMGKAFMRKYGLVFINRNNES
jgi:hypothetical protein|tara:strand:+ start:208 stop:759 length:552 start_codon:yes stop_codon:yes gene_type:complete